MPPSSLEDENISQKFAAVILNLVLAEIAIMGSTAVADFDLQPSFTKKERKDFKPDRSFSETRPR